VSSIAHERSRAAPTTTFLPAPRRSACSVKSRCPSAWSARSTGREAQCPSTSSAIRSDAKRTTLPGEARASTLQTTHPHPVGARPSQVNQVRGPLAVCLDQTYQCTTGIGAGFGRGHATAEGSGRSGLVDTVRRSGLCLSGMCAPPFLARSRIAAGGRCHGPAVLRHLSASDVPAMVLTKLGASGEVSANRPA